MKLKRQGKPRIKGIRKKLMFSKAIPQEPAKITTLQNVCRKTKRGRMLMKTSPKNLRIKLITEHGHLFLNDAGLWKWNSSNKTNTSNYISISQKNAKLIISYKNSQNCNIGHICIFKWQVFRKEVTPPGRRWGEGTQGISSVTSSPLQEHVLWWNWWWQNTAVL